MFQDLGLAPTNANLILFVLMIMAPLVVPLFVFWAYQRLWERKQAHPTGVLAKRLDGIPRAIRIVVLLALTVILIPAVQAVIYVVMLLTGGGR